MLRHLRTKTELVTAVSVESEWPVRSFVLLRFENEGAKLVGGTGQADGQGPRVAVNGRIKLASGVVVISWGSPSLELHVSNVNTVVDT